MCLCSLASRSIRPGSRSCLRGNHPRWCVLFGNPVGQTHAAQRARLDVQVHVDSLLRFRLRFLPSVLCSRGRDLPVRPEGCSVCLRSLCCSLASLKYSMDSIYCQGIFNVKNKKVAGANCLHPSDLQVNPQKRGELFSRRHGQNGNLSSIHSWASWLSGSSVGTACRRPVWFGGACPSIQSRTRSDVTP